MPSVSWRLGRAQPQREPIRCLCTTRIVARKLQRQKPRPAAWRNRVAGRVRRRGAGPHAAAAQRKQASAKTPNAARQRARQPHQSPPAADQRLTAHEQEPIGLNFFASKNKSGSLSLPTRALGAHCAPTPAMNNFDGATPTPSEPTTKRARQRNNKAHDSYACPRARANKLLRKYTKRVASRQLSTPETSTTHSGLLSHHCRQRRVLLALLPA